MQKLFIAQPVIRLQSAGMVDMIDGRSTSFIHAATECWQSDHNTHFKALDTWLEFFSSLGLYVGHLCLKPKTAPNDWAGRSVVSEMLRINYSGLEIGVANYFANIPQRNNQPATLSDVGVGLERLLWAINRSKGYFDAIGPFDHSTSVSRSSLDAVRTATLMASSSVEPSHHDHGYKLRSSLRQLASNGDRVDIYELVRFFYLQWERSIIPQIPFEPTYRTLRAELDRHLNSKIARKIGLVRLGRRNGARLDRHSFIEYLIETRVVGATAIHDMMRSIAMKTFTSKIFVGGGGSTEQSLALDQEFAAHLDSAKPLIYIPNAMAKSKHAAGLKWIRSAMRPLGILKIEMWNDLRAPLPPGEIAGIYLGGGNTLKLLRELRHSGFSRYLKRAVQSGTPIYGGSAGAIVLGDDIRTAPEASDRKNGEARGLRLVPGYSIACHFDGKRLANTTLDLASKSPVIALPETAGAVILGRTLRCIGSPITVFTGKRQKVLKAGAEYHLRG